MSLWIQLPDVDPNKILFVKGRFRVGFMCPHVLLDPGLSMSLQQRQQICLLKLILVAIRKVICALNGGMVLYSKGRSLALAQDSVLTFWWLVQMNGDALDL
jgi:hypothetical protein